MKGRAAARTSGATGAVRDHRDQAGRDRVDVERVDELAHRELGHRAARRRDDGCAVRHRLEHGHAEALPQRREGEGRGARVGRLQVGVVQPAEQVHAARRARRRGRARRPRSASPHPDGPTSTRSWSSCPATRAYASTSRGTFLRGSSVPHHRMYGRSTCTLDRQVSRLPGGDLVGSHPVRDHRDAVRLEPVRHAVVPRRPRRDDDLRRLGAHDVERPPEERVAASREVVGLPQEREVVHRDHERRPAPGDRPRRRVDDVDARQGRLRARPTKSRG